MERDAEQAALRRGVHRQVERDALHHAIEHTKHASGRLLEHEKVARPEKRHRNRLVETANHRSYGEVGIDDGWRGRLRVD